MSWQATAYVKNLRAGLTRSEKFLLLVLADYHNDENQRCDASVKRLAGDCLMSERMVQLVLGGLESKGFITIERRADETGRSRTNQYWLTCLNDIGGEGVMVTPPQGETGITPRVKRGSPQGETGIRGEGETGFTQTVNKNLKVNRKVNSDARAPEKTLFDQGDPDDHRTQANRGGAATPTDPDPLADRIQRLDGPSTLELLRRRAGRR